MFSVKCYFLRFEHYGNWVCQAMSMSERVGMCSLDLLAIG